MNLSAVFHRPLSEYAHAVDESTYVFRLRTARDDLKNVLFFYADRADMSPKLTFQSLPMPKVRSDKLYDWYNPADAVNLDLPQTEAYEINPMEDEDIIRFIEAIGNNRYRLIYLITLFTGLREGEVLGLSWNDINWRDHILTIRQQLSINRETREYGIRRPKNKKTRHILVADAVMDLLKEQKDYQEQLRTMAGKAWSNEWNLVFTKEDGSHLAVSTVYNNYKRLVVKIDHGEQRFHDLRHSFASNSLENGDDIKTVQENLGHHSAAFTLKQYGHVKKTMSIASAQRMDLFIRNVMPGNG